MKGKKLNLITKSAIIAALYAALTLILSPISFGIIQFRISEMLTVLPVYTVAAIPGLAIGCLISNSIGMIFSGLGIVDVIFGTVATLISALFSYKFRKKLWLVPLFPVVFNALIVGTYLHILVFNKISIWLCILSVAIGEAAVTYLLGIPLIKVLNKRIGDILND